MQGKNAQEGKSAAEGKVAAQARRVPRAKDIMTCDVIGFDEGTTVAQASRRLITAGISAAPVLTRGGHLAGVLSEEDLLGVFYEGHRNLERVKIGDCAVLGSSLVTRRVLTVSEDTPLRQIAKTMMIKKVKRLFVVDADRKVLGVVSRRDILKAMAATA